MTSRSTTHTPANTAAAPAGLSPLSEKTLPRTCVRLDTPLEAADVPRLRKFICSYIGAENDLFHNHRSREKYHYRYPLVQYKSIGGRAAIIGLGEEGTAALNQLLENEGFISLFRSGPNGPALFAEQTSETLRLLPIPTQTYRLNRYIALNDPNLRAWETTPSLAARAALLERCLVGHLLKFASAVRWLLPPRSLMVELLDFRVNRARSFEADFHTFDILFRTNIELPEHIGLGKAVSHGFGLVFRVRDSK